MGELYEWMVNVALGLKHFPVQRIYFNISIQLRVFPVQWTAIEMVFAIEMQVVSNWDSQCGVLHELQTFSIRQYFFREILFKSR